MYMYSLFLVFCIVFANFLNGAVEEVSHTYEVVPFEERNIRYDNAVQEEIRSIMRGENFKVLAWIMMKNNICVVTDLLGVIAGYYRNPYRPMPFEVNNGTALMCRNPEGRVAFVIVPGTHASPGTGNMVNVMNSSTCPDNPTTVTIVTDPSDNNVIKKYEIDDQSFQGAMPFLESFKTLGFPTEEMVRYGNVRDNNGLFRRVN